MYVVLYGSATVRLHGETVGVLRSGETIGEMALLTSDARRTSTCRGRRRSS